MDAELLLPMFWEWVEFGFRWLHVVCAVAWIGSSFYFIALDLGLRKAAHAPQGVHGEEWQVHGGGFYHIQKYLVAPEAMPEDLIWFKWESYITWVSGFILMVLVYYMGAELYLIDANKVAFSPLGAIMVSLISIGVIWLGYNALCTSTFGDNNTSLMIILYVLLVAVSWGYNQIFTGRAALLHLGAITATIMSANVFLIIIPNQKIVVADLKAGRTPDARYGKIAKQRSTHNNYLTLPVLFLMLSNHYPLAFATEYSWIIASLVFLMGVSIRYYFNTCHARKGNPLWVWLVTAALFITVSVLSILPFWHNQTVAKEQSAVAVQDTAPILGSAERRLLNDPNFEDVYDIVMGRCSMCHANEPLWEGISVPPKGVVFETEGDVVAAANAIFMQSGLSHAMPPANLTELEDDERALIRLWYLNGTASQS